MLICNCANGCDRERSNDYGRELDHVSDDGDDDHGNVSVHDHDHDCDYDDDGDDDC